MKTHRGEGPLKQKKLKTTYCLTAKSKDNNG